MYFNKNIVISEVINYSYNQTLLDLNKVFNVAYGIDKNFQFGCGVSISSILLHNPNFSFHFHIFTDVLDEEFQSKIDLLAKQYSSSITIYLIDCEELKVLPSTKNWSHAIYFRFIATDYFQGVLDKILYVDADVICKNSLQELYNLDISDYIAAVVPEGEQPWWDKRAKSLNTKTIKLGYFNSGVLLINLNKWNDFDVTEKTMKMLNDDSFRKIISFPDQDILNILLSQYVYFLDKNYNQQFSINYELKAAKKSFYKHPINDNTIFIHYIGPTKPWHEWAEPYPSAAYFIQAKKHSPWSNEPLLSAVSANQCRYCAKHKFHQGKIFSGIMSYLKYYWKKLSK